MAAIWFDKNAPPFWVLQDASAIANPNYRRGLKYYQKMFRAQPWWADKAAIAEVYSEAIARRRRGEDVVVDHIVPLSNPLVCGLHCHRNLQIIARKDNAQKSNNVWPDMPFEQLSLFD